MRYLFTLLLCCVGLSGCITPIMKPQVSLDRFQVVSNLLPQSEQTYIAVLRIHNANNKPMRAEGLQVALVLDGDEPVKGVSNEPINVPPLGDQLVQVQVDRKPVIRRDRKGLVPYKINGDVRLNGVGPMPFYNQGELMR